MSGFLDTILAHTREAVATSKQKTTLAELRDRPSFSSPTRSLRSALAGNGLAVIAEIKKASPSKGVIRESFDHRNIARQYEQGGAMAISVLTENEFFQGRLTYLEEVRSIVSLPLLRKDFIIDSYQLTESRAFGADALLLIATALTRGQLQELHAESEQLGMECLVEVHSEEEVLSLSGINARMIGVNNRNLSTFETDLGLSVHLRPLLPPEAVAVSESGIESAIDIRLLADHGYDAVLIGETLMKSKQPGDALKRLIAEVATT